MMPHGPGSAQGGPLSICYVLAAFPVLSETFVTNEIRAMRRLGHRIVPIALAPHDGPCQAEDEPMRAEAVHLATIPTLAAAAAAALRPAGMAGAVAFARRQTGLPAKSLLRAATRVALVARRHGCSHIHAHYAHVAGATAIAAARIAGVTASFIAHGYDIYGEPTDLPLKLGAIDVAFATCDDMLADFRRMAPGVNALTATCGIDPTRFVPAHDDASNGRLLAIGRLVPQKGYPTLIEALARLPPGRRPVVDVVGIGPLDDDLRDLAARAGVADSIRFLGRRESTWIAAEGPRYQGFVAPYVICDNNDRDSSPVAVKEALAMGLPVVASALMGMKESVSPSCGRHVTPGDVADLAAALDWLAGLDAAQRRALGQAGRRHVIANFTLDRQAALMTAAIRAVRAGRADRTEAAACAA